VEAERETVDGSEEKSEGVVVVLVVGMYMSYVLQ